MAWVHSWYDAVYKASYEDIRRMADAWYVGSGSNDWFKVAQQHVKETLDEDMSQTEGFVRIASGTLISVH